MNKSQLREIIKSVVYRKIMEATTMSDETEPTEPPVSPALQQKIDDVTNKIKNKKEKVAKLKGEIAKLQEPIKVKVQRAERIIAKDEKEIGTNTAALEKLTKQTGNVKKPTPPVVKSNNPAEM